MTVLYLTEPGNTLAAAARTLVVRKGTEERVQVPVIGLERVVVLAPSHLTSAAVSLCAREDVELVVVAHGARVMSRLGASDAGLALRAEQYRRAADEGFCLAFARTVVAGKVRNQRRGLGRSPTATDDDVALVRAELEVLLQRSAAAETAAALRGLEGRASALYFRALRRRLNPEFGFRSRNRRPPRDPANAMLSLAYTLLTAEAAAAVCAAGLEPALGFYHRARGGRPALPLDLVEEFRAAVADSLVLQLTGWRALRPDQFRQTDRGVRMTAAARRRFLEGYEAKLTQPFTDRAGAATTLRRSIRGQAQRLAAAVRGEAPYACFELP